MNFRIRFLSSFTAAIMTLLLTIFLVQAGITLAADPGPIEDTSKPTPRSLVSLSEEQAAKLTPMNKEIRLVLLAERDEVERLTASLAGVKDDTEAIAIQRQIGAVKQQAEIDIMEVQIRFSEAAGNHEQAEAIREAIAGMKEQLTQRMEDSGGRP